MTIFHGCPNIQSFNSAADSPQNSASRKTRQIQRRKVKGVTPLKYFERPWYVYYTNMNFTCSLYVSYKKSLVQLLCIFVYFLLLSFFFLFPSKHKRTLSGFHSSLQMIARYFHEKKSCLVKRFLLMMRICRKLIEFDKLFS